MYLPSTRLVNTPGSRSITGYADFGGEVETITLIGLIERFTTMYHGKYVFCGLTPGKGDLEEQSKDKMDRFSSNLQSGTLADVLTNGFLY